MGLEVRIRYMSVLLSERPHSLLITRFLVTLVRLRVFKDLGVCVSLADAALNNVNLKFTEGGTSMGCTPKSCYRWHNSTCSRLSVIV